MFMTPFLRRFLDVITALSWQGDEIWAAMEAGAQRRWVRKWKHPRPRRFLFKGRMATLARLLRMDTWTKAAPPASEIKLTVSLHDSDVAEEARALLEPNTLPPYVCIGETPGRPATTPAEGGTREAE
eukprot:jgi/Bigna1/83976/fgenesh1_pg.119_\